MRSARPESASLPRRRTVPENLMAGTELKKRNGGPLVLNVNDNDASRYLVTRMLEKGGFTVIDAANGGGALDQVRDKMPRLVVLDIKLPDMTGLEVCQLIKADPKTHGV